MDNRLVREKFEELNIEMVNVINIAEYLDTLCESGNVEEHAYKLKIFIELLKEKCLILDYKHCELHSLSIN